MAKIFFVSGNEEKFGEVQEFCKTDNVAVEMYKKDIKELQTETVKELVEHKALEAFKEVRRPVLVEHTALYIRAFGEMPGLQTAYFYKHLGCQEIISYCNYKNDHVAIAKSFFCFCDGIQFLHGSGSELGHIKKEYDLESEGFDWDRIFIPDEDNPEQKTYVVSKKERSMRKKAWEDLKPGIENWLSNQETKRMAEETEQENHIKKLAGLIKEKRVLLFLGAGISASIGFPSWNRMIMELGEQEGYDSRLFEVYGDKLTLAEFINRDTEEKTYQFLENRFQLNEEMEEKLKTSEIYRILYELDFPVIYTTNYDNLIETYYGMQKHKYNKVSRIEDNENNKPDSTRIMKFHGDIGVEENIVLTESQYFKRMDFQNFMDIQLQADLTQYHVLFLGYGISDVNIKLLLYNAAQRWGTYKKRKNSYVFTATPNAVQKAVFEKNGIISISAADILDKEKATLEFLRKLLEYTK